MGHATHAPKEFLYPGLHTFLHAPDVSGNTLEAFTSVVVQADAKHPDIYAVGVVPESPVVVQTTHVPDEFFW